MKEQLITFKTAKLAREKGFNIFTQYYYDNDNPLSSNINIRINYIHSNEELGMIKPMGILHIITHQLNHCFKSG